MNVAFINFWAVKYSRESVYTQQEILWLMSVLYKHHKNKEKCMSSTKSLLIICANSDVGNLYQLYKTFCDGGIIRPIDIKRGTFKP